MKCPKCGYKPPPKKPVGKPRLFTADQEKEIAEDRKRMKLFDIAIKWKCSVGTIQNIIKSNLK